MLNQYPPERLKSLRKRAMLTQMQVVELTGISEATLCYLERGDRRPQTRTLHAGRPTGSRSPAYRRGGDRDPGSPSQSGQGRSRHAHPGSHHRCHGQDRREVGEEGTRSSKESSAGRNPVIAAQGIQVEGQKAIRRADAGGSPFHAQGYLGGRP